MDLILLLTFIPVLAVFLHSRLLLLLLLCYAMLCTRCCRCRCRCRCWCWCWCRRKSLNTVLGPRGRGGGREGAEGREGGRAEVVSGTLGGGREEGRGRREWMEKQRRR